MINIANLEKEINTKKNVRVDIFIITIDFILKISKSRYRSSLPFHKNWRFQVLKKFLN